MLLFLVTSCLVVAVQSCMEWIPIKNTSWCCRIKNNVFASEKHCVKSVHIRSFFGPYFPAFGLNTGKYGPEKLRIRTLFTQWNEGASLQDCLYKSMQLTPFSSLNFCFLLTAGRKSTFLQISIDKNSRNYLRFLLFDDVFSGNRNTYEDGLQELFLTW